MAMEKIQDKSGEFTGLAVLEPPVLQFDYWEFLMPLLLGMVIAGILIFLFVRYQRSAQVRAKRSLDALHIQLLRQTRDEREIVFRLAETLRHGLSLPAIRVSSLVMTADADMQRRWYCFVENLSVARYARPGPDKSLVDELLGESRFWLRQWRLFHRN